MIALPGLWWTGQESHVLAPATLEQYHSIVSGALKAVLTADLVTRNVATRVNGRPKRVKNHEAIDLMCSDSDEARRFLATAAAPKL